MADKTSLKEIAAEKDISPPFSVKKDLFPKYQNGGPSDPGDAGNLNMVASVKKSVNTETVEYNRL